MWLQYLYKDYCDHVSVMFPSILQFINTLYAKLLDNHALPHEFLSLIERDVLRLHSYEQIKGGYI